MLSHGCCTCSVDTPSSKIPDQQVGPLRLSELWSGLCETNMQGQKFLLNLPRSFCMHFVLPGLERRNRSALLTRVIHPAVFVICFLFGCWISSTCLQWITADFIILPPLQSGRTVFSGWTSKLPSCSFTVENDINQQT